MISKKEQLKQSEIPPEAKEGLVKFFYTLSRLGLIQWTTSRLKNGKVTHFCKRYLSRKYKWVRKEWWQD